MRRNVRNIVENLTVGSGAIAGIGVNQEGQPTADTFGEPPMPKQTLKKLKKHLQQVKIKNGTK